MTLAVVGIAGGVLAGISPCILPILPVVLISGTTDAVGDRRSAQRRALLTVAGLVVSFSLLTIAGTALLRTLHLPLGVAHAAGLAILALVGLGLVFPPLGRLLERPFIRLTPSTTPRRSGHPLLVGFGLGAVFVPCAGPVLAAIAFVGDSGRIGSGAVVLTIAFALGVAVPLGLLALSGVELTSRVRSLQHRAGLLRRIGGGVLLLSAVVLWTGAANGFEQNFSNYVTSLQHQIEGNPTARNALDQLRGVTGSLQQCQPAPVLINCGPAPDFAPGTSWLNTPGGRPISLNELRGKVVLVDFWTYSCINCERTLPHLEAWAARYRSAGLVVIGDHFPEFAFEADPHNVADAARALGITYPIALDPSGNNWSRYLVQYWPTEYLIDARGEVRHLSIGEGDYSHTEQLIRQLLASRGSTAALPPPTEVTGIVPSAQPLTPEIHFGSQWGDPAVQAPPGSGLSTSQLPATVSLDEVALGGTFDHQSDGVANRGPASLRLHYQAKSVYLVVGGSGELTITHADGTTTRMRIGGYPHLVRVEQRHNYGAGTVTIALQGQLTAYSFTFG